MRNTARTAFLGLLLAAGSHVPVAVAQNALGDGRLLDANSSQSGRSNNQVKDIGAQIRFNNRIIEGQAGDGRSFRGSLGYRAVDDFAGSLGSDQLYAFRRDSISNVNATIPGLRTSDALRYQFGLTGGGGGRSAGLPSSADELFIARRGTVSVGSYLASPTGDVAGAPRQTNLVAAMRSIAQYQTVSALMPTVLGYTSTDGGRMAITASPLRGVAPIVTQGPADRDGAAIAGAPAASSAYLGSSLTGMERRAFGVEGVGRTEAAPAVEPLTQRLAPDGTPYKDVMDALSRASDLRIEARPEEPGPLNRPDGAKPNETKPNAGKPDATKSAKPDDTPSWMKGLDYLRNTLRTPDGTTQPEKPATKAPQPTPSPALRPGEEPAANPAEASRPGAHRDLEREKILEGLKRMRLRIDTFKPTETASQAYARSMAEAETQLGAGEYFAAEGSFSMALVAKPRDVMAAIGRAHAQIGAGLFISAAGNLRDTFAEHPEIVPVVFGPTLLPNPVRCDEVINRIHKDLADPGSGLSADGALLLAYLGRQLGRSDLLNEGVREFEQRTRPEDTSGKALAALLRDVWTAPPAPGVPSEK